MAQRAQAAQRRAYGAQFNEITGATLPPEREEQQHEEQVEVAQPAAQATERAAETGNPDPTNTRWERARRAFKRIGQDIEELKGSREQVIRRGLKLADTQDSQARDRAELERYRKGAPAPGRESQSSTAPASEDTQSGVPSSSAVIDRLVNSLSDLDEDAHTRIKDIIAPFLADYDRLRSENDEMRQANDAEGQTDVRAALTKMFSDAADDDDWARIKRTADRLKSSGDLVLPDASRGEQDLARYAAAARALGLAESRRGDSWSNGSASSGSMEVNGIAAQGGRPIVQQPATPEQAKEAAKQAFLSLRRRNDLAGLRR